MSAEAISMGAQISESFYSLLSYAIVSIALFCFQSVMILFAIICVAMLLLLHGATKE